MILLISYDLNDRERPDAYEAVASEIAKRAVAWTRPLYSQWLVATEASQRAWTNALVDLVEDDDKLLIVEVTTGSYHGYLSQSAWRWLKHRGLHPCP